MSKRVLILVLSADFPPYDRMITTAQETWNSVEVENMETVFYCGESDKTDTDKIIYLPVKESLHTMGHKLLLALGWSLKNKEFDYLARPHSSIYVNKKELMNYVNTLPETNVFSAIGVDADPRWAWGGLGYVYSKDVIEKIIANKEHYRHDLMEDMAQSYLINKLEIPYTNGMGCSIDKKENGWLCLSYGGTETFEFSDFSEITKSKGQYYYRVKQDGKREVDEHIMRELFKHLT